MNWAVMDVCRAVGVSLPCASWRPRALSLPRCQAQGPLFWGARAHCLVHGFETPFPLLPSPSDSFRFQLRHPAFYTAHVFQPLNCCTQQCFNHACPKCANAQSLDLSRRQRLGRRDSVRSRAPFNRAPKHCVGARLRRGQIQAARWERAAHAMSAKKKKT